MPDGALLGKGYIELTVQGKDTDPFKHIKTGLRDVEDHAKKTGQQVETSFTASLRGAASNMRELSQVHKEHESTFKNWQSAFKEYNQEREKYSAAQKTYHTEANRALEQNIVSSTQLAKLYDNMQAAHERALAKLGPLQAAQQRFMDNQSRAQELHRSFIDNVANASVRGVSTTYHAVSRVFQGVGDLSAKVIKHVGTFAFHTAQHAVKTMESVFMSLGRSIGLGALLGGVGGLGSLLFKGFERLDTIETIRTKLIFFGHSLRDVNGIMKDTEVMADRTSMSLTDMAQATLVFTQLGVKPGEDLKRLLQDVADLSAATGDSVVSVSDTMVRLMQGNTQSAAAMLQNMAEKGVPIIHWLAEAYKVSDAEMTKMVRKGEIDWAHFEYVIETHLAGISQAMSNTFGAQMRRLWEGVSKVGAAFLEPFFGSATAGMGQLRGGMDRLVHWLETNQPQIVEMVGKIGVGFLELGKGVLQFFITTSHALAVILRGLSHLPGMGALGAAAESLDRGAKVLEDRMVPWFDRAIESTQRWANELAQSTRLTGALKSGLDDVADATLDLNKNPGQLTILDNSEVVEGNLDKLGLKTKALPNGDLTIVPKIEGDAAAEALINDYLISQKKPPIYLDVFFRMHPENAPFWWDRYGGLQTAPQVVGPPIPPTPSGLPPGVTPYMPPGGGGYARGGFLPSAATIQSPVGPAGLVQWAEPSTGGEAFIPLNGGARSRAIWLETGRQLSMRSFAVGALNAPSAVSAPAGSLTLPIVAAIARKFGLKVTSAYRNEPGSFHGAGEALDLSDGDQTENEWRFATFMARTYGGSLAELIHENKRGFALNIKNGRVVGPFGQFYTMGQAGYHGDHVHIAIHPSPETAPGMFEKTRRGYSFAGASYYTSARYGSGGGDPVSAIYREGIRRGYSPAHIAWIVATAIGESGLNPGIADHVTGTHFGLFQQDSSYPLRNTMIGQIVGFYDRLERASGRTIGEKIVNVERGGYGPSWIQQFLPQARARMSGLGGGYSGGVRYTSVGFGTGGPRGTFPLKPPPVPPPPLPPDWKPVTTPNMGLGGADDTTDPVVGGYDPSTDTWAPSAYDTGDYGQFTPEQEDQLQAKDRHIEDLNRRLAIAQQQLENLKKKPKVKATEIEAKQRQIDNLITERDQAVDQKNDMMNKFATMPHKRGRGGGGILDMTIGDFINQRLMPDLGAFGDIGLGGVKESLLPPGFSDPSTWGVFQALGGFLNFLGGRMPQPFGGLFSAGGALATGSGSGLGGAISGMLPYPFGSYGKSLLDDGSQRGAYRPGIKTADTPDMVTPYSAPGGLPAPTPPVGGLSIHGAAGGGGNVVNDNRVQVGNVNANNGDQVVAKIINKQAPVVRAALGRK